MLDNGAEYGDISLVSPHNSLSGFIAFNVLCFVLNQRGTLQYNRKTLVFNKQHYKQCFQIGFNSENTFTRKYIHEHDFW